MGFTKTGATVNKQRVITLAGVLSHSKAGSVGKLIGSAHDEGLEGILVIAVFAVHAGRHRRYSGLWIQLIRWNSSFSSRHHRLRPLLTADNNLNVDINTQHFLEGSAHIIHIALLQEVFLQRGTGRKNSKGTVKGNQFHFLDPEIVGDRRQVTIFFDRVLYILKEFRKVHDLTSLFHSFLQGIYGNANVISTKGKAFGK